MQEFSKLTFQISFHFFIDNFKNISVHYTYSVINCKLNNELYSIIIYQMLMKHHLRSQTISERYRDLLHIRFYLNSYKYIELTELVNTKL